jgi:hypothetical protein
VAQTEAAASSWLFLGGFARRKENDRELRVIPGIIESIFQFTLPPSPLPRAFEKISQNAFRGEKYEEGTGKGGK